MTIYSVVKDLAKSRGISIYRIEHDLNLPNGIIGKWDKSIPRTDKLNDVANYLGVTMAFILNKSKED